MWLALAIIVLCMFVFSIRQNKKMQETFMDNRRKIGDVNASLQDTLAGIRVVQSFTNEEIERKKFQKSNHAFLLSKKENYHCIGSFMGWNLLFQGLMYSVTLIYGGYLIAKGFMNVGDLAMYALYIGIFIVLCGDRSCDTVKGRQFQQILKYTGGRCAKHHKD